MYYVHIVYIAITKLAKFVCIRITLPTLSICLKWVGSYLVSSNEIISSYQTPDKVHINSEWIYEDIDFPN